MVSLPILLLTTFISVNGQIQQVPIDSPEAIEYELKETDIGKYTFDNQILSITNTDSGTVINLPENISSDNLTDTEVIEPDTSLNDNLLDVSGGDMTSVMLMSGDEITELLNEQIDLLAENSSSVTGTLNSTVLDLMDRMIDDYPSYYKYVGFRTNVDDAYQATLYLSKSASYNNDVISLGDDCIAVNFYRVSQGNNYNYYLTYNRYESPNATVRINDNTIIYTNVVDGYPALGNHARFEVEYFWIGLFVIVATVLFTRRMSHG